MTPVLLAGIALAVDSRVVPLWRDYLGGGSAPRDLTPTFGADFTKSPTTRKTTAFLLEKLEESLKSAPPTNIAGEAVRIDLSTRIGSSIAELDVPGGPHEMNFNVPSDIAGNLAGGIGKDQLTCKAGAMPSPFNDERHATGTALVTRTSTGLHVEPSITYLVKDTIDLCPGDCGTSTEQLATVPMSQFEATGIAGDVPFTINFDADAAPFEIPLASPPMFGPPKAPPPPLAPAPATGVGPGGNDRR